MVPICEFVSMEREWKLSLRTRGPTVHCLIVYMELLVTVPLSDTAKLKETTGKLSAAPSTKPPPVLFRFRRVSACC